VARGRARIAVAGMFTTAAAQKAGRAADGEL